MQSPKSLVEHQWLMRLVGDWEFDTECNQGPDKPPVKSNGTEVVNSLGQIWSVGEMKTSMPNGEPVKSIMTLGYDSETKRFVGTFVASMTTHLWVYNGSLDPKKNVLTLDTEGPSFQGDGTTAKYQDIIEFIDDDHRTLSSQFLENRQLLFARMAPRREEHHDHGPAPQLRERDLRVGRP